MTHTVRIPTKTIEGVQFPDYQAITLADWERYIGQAIEGTKHIWEQAKADPNLTLDSTFLALERCHSVLTDVMGPFALLVDGGNEEAMVLYEKFSGTLAQINVQHMSDPVFASRCQKLFDEQGKDWPEHQKRAAEQWLLQMRLTGSLLETDTQREKLGAIAGELAELESRFQQLNGKACDGMLWLDENQLRGVDVQALEKGEGENAGKFGVRMIREPVELVLGTCEVRDTRKAVFQAFENRGTKDDITGTYTGDVIERILVLRQEKAELLGFANYAELKLAGTMAKTPEAANELLERTWNIVAPAGKGLIENIKAAAKEDRVELEPWDTIYYAARVEGENKDTGPKATLGQTREAIFKLANTLFGLSFEKVDVACPWDGMACWLVRREGQAIGGLFTDFSARAGKPSGAWMHLLFEGHRLDGGQLPVVANTSNFGEGDDAEMSAMDVRTAFHEFGHGLHGLLGRTNLPSQCGTNTLHDWVELPSQLLENWAVDQGPALGLPKGSAGHDGSQADQIMKVRYLQSAVLDMKLHTQGLGGKSIAQFESEVLEGMGADPLISPWHRLSHFSHLFSGDQYASGYYAYLWAEALDADVYQRARKEDPLSPHTGKRLEEFIYSAGDERHPQELFGQFMGRDPDPMALIRRLGLAPNVPLVKAPRV